MRRDRDRDVRASDEERRQRTSLPGPSEPPREARIRRSEVRQLVGERSHRLPARVEHSRAVGIARHRERSRRELAEAVDAVLDLLLH